MHKQILHGSAAGFTLVELMVVMSITAFLLFMVGPPIASTMRAAQARSLVYRFVTDLTWLRNQAATTAASGGPPTMVLDASCQWTPSNVNAAQVAAHSNTLSAMSASLHTLVCTPATLSFNAQGQLLGTAVPPLTFSFTDSVYNSSWALQVATSGSVLVASGVGAQ